MTYTKQFLDTLPNMRKDYFDRYLKIQTPTRQIWITKDPPYEVTKYQLNKDGTMEQLEKYMVSEK